MRESVDLHFRALKGQPLAAIAAVAMDMWGAFLAPVSEHVPMPNARSPSAWAPCR